MRFDNRTQAGRELGRMLSEWSADADLVDPLVLALPRGGVPVAAEVARALRVPLDVLVVCKIGMPGQPEAALGAIVGEGPPMFNQQTLRHLGLSEDLLSSDVARKRSELRRREALYRRGRLAPSVTGRTVIVVDDGLATGSTAAALRHLRGRRPARLILAVPVRPPATVATMNREADEFVCVYQPRGFHAVSQWYDDFARVSDDEVIRTLADLSLSR